MEDISAEEFKILSNNPTAKYALLDVREELEFYTYNIGGENIPLGKLSHVLADDDFPFDKEETIILICQRGLRSKTAKLLLQQHGFTKTQNLLGGLLKLQRLIA